MFAQMIWMPEFSPWSKRWSRCSNRNILRQYGQADQAKLIKNASTKGVVLEVLASAARGFDRLRAVQKRVDQKTLESLPANLQAPPLAEIADMKTLRKVVFGLEDLADSSSAHRA